MREACHQKKVIVQEATVRCPQIDEQVWDAHPVVYLQIPENSEVSCPYCATTYIRKNDE